MDDKFLYLLREQPDPKFVKNLHKTLSSPQLRSNRRWDIFSDVFHGNGKAKLYWITALIAVLFKAAMIISPVRAIILAYPKEVAGRIFDISDDYPYSGNDVETIDAQIMSLDEALATFPYDVILPDNVPSEYVLDKENVSVYTGIDNMPAMLIITWKSDGKGLSLSICGDCEWEHGEIIAPEAVEEVLLDNQYPAVLIRGGWYENEKVWNYDAALTLEWQVENMLYSLSSSGMGTMTPEQLIELATSTIR